MTGDTYYSPDNLCHILHRGNGKNSATRENVLSQKQNSAVFSQDKIADDTKGKKGR
jgi:hypothetical protein